MYLCTVLADKFRPCHNWECPNPSRRTVCKNVSLRFVDVKKLIAGYYPPYKAMAKSPEFQLECAIASVKLSFQPLNPMVKANYWTAEITFDPVEVETRNNDQTAGNEFGNGCRDLKTRSKTAEGKEVHPRDEHLNLSKWCPKFHQKLLWQNWIICD